jgi:hypothetical protein
MMNVRLTPMLIDRWYLRLVALSAALAMGLGGCGGGKGDTPPATDSPPSSTAPANPVAPTPPPSTGPAVPPSAAGARWSDPATWGGTVPAAGAKVRIPVGQTVLLDSATANLGALVIEGKLIADSDRDVSITADYVLVSGRAAVLQIGTAAQPYLRKATITLTGEPSDADVMGMGTKFFGAMDGATIDLHGDTATSWTKLDLTAEAGSTRVKVLEAEKWRVGDRIAIAPTDFEPLEAEERTITGVSGTNLTLDKPLAHRHWGKVQTLGTTGATLDQRAEVGLLSRNIVIRGQNAAGSYFGGHVMFMTDAVARLSGVEFAGLGQLGRAGRYPVHFHLLGEGGSKSYLKNSTIRHTLQRAVVLHQSNNILVQNNVVFDVTGHAMFLESAVEVNNTFDRNLVMLVRVVPKPYRAEGKEFELCDCFYGAQSQSMHDRITPSGFWISNQHNRLTNNTVAGVQLGYGYWYNETEMSVADQSRFYNNGNIFQGLKPEALRRPFLEFRDNTAHSISAKNDAGITTQYTRPVAAGLFFEQLSFFPNQPGTDPVFKNFRVWKVSQTGVWAQTFSERGARPQDKAAIVDGLISADNRSALFVEQGAGPTRVRNSVMFGFTDNLAPGMSSPTWAGAWRPFWESLNHSLENVEIQSVATSPNTLANYNDLSATQMLSLRANDGLNTPVFLEWSNVITKGFVGK